MEQQAKDYSDSLTGKLLIQGLGVLIALGGIVIGALFTYISARWLGGLAVLELVFGDKVAAGATDLEYSVLTALIVGLTAGILAALGTATLFSSDEDPQRVFKSNVFNFFAGCMFGVGPMTGYLLNFMFYATIAVVVGAAIGAVGCTIFKMFYTPSSPTGS